MKLYTSSRAPNPRRVDWVLAEKGIDDIERTSLDLLTGEHRAAEYVAKAGLPVVPALELDDGAVITESLAICRYLESLKPEPNLFGRSAEETAIIEMWTRRAEMMLATPLMLAVRHTHPALAALETQVAEVGAWNRQGGERALKLFDRQLADSEFVAGGRMTMADIVAFCGIDFARLIRFAVPEGFVNVRRWAAQMSARPAARAGG